MSGTLGVSDECDTFMSDWGSTYKSGRNQMVRFMPEASDYGNE